LLIPLVTTSNLSAQWKTLLSGALAVGIPEIGTILAIAIMGKSGFDTMKYRIFGFLKKHGPADRVSLARYRIGLVMFGIPLLFGWISPYLQNLIPRFEENRLLLAAAGDLLFIGSLIVLGGDFWDKVRSLFVHDAIAVLPDKTESEKA
ncbi:MAG: hypothetical protein WBN03_15040, partial [Desulfobacterales bacterium]